MLAVLAVLELCLGAAVSAIITMHPELRSDNGLEEERPRRPAVCVWVGHELIGQPHALLDTIHRYRIALEIPCPRCHSCNALSKDF
jgi:hypothetical protein